MSSFWSCFSTKNIDLTILQKKLSNLNFCYTIPSSHLSFAVQNTSFKFIYNSSYNEFVAHDATTYEEFISTHSTIPIPQIPQPSGSTTTATLPSTPVNPMASLYEPVRSIRPQTSDPRSRLSRTNISLLHQSVSVAI